MMKSDGVDAETKRLHLEREAAKANPLRHASPTHGEDGERLRSVRRVHPSLSAEDCPIIAPVCATCGHEIDKTPDGVWFHVAVGR